MELVRVNVADLEPEALHQPQAQAAEQTGGEPGGAIELDQRRVSSRLKTVGSRSDALARMT